MRVTLYTIISFIWCEKYAIIAFL